MSKTLQRFNYSAMERAKHTVVQEAIFHQDGDQVPDRYANFVLFPEGGKQYVGTVGRGYQLISNEELIDSVETALSQSSIKTEKAERRVHVSPDFRKMNYEVILHDYQSDLDGFGDRLSPALTISNSYDGTNKVEVGLFVYRLVCTNGLMIPVEMVGLVKKHTANLDLPYMISKLEEVLNSPKLEEAFEKFRNFIKINLNAANVREDVQFTVDTKKEDMADIISKDSFVAKLMEYPTRFRKGIVERWDSAIAAGKPATAWTFYNVLTDIATHESATYDIYRNRSLMALSITMAYISSAMKRHDSRQTIAMMPSE